MALGGALGLGLGARDAAAFCVAGAASTVVLRGRRGTNSHLPSFCVAGVALMVLGGALGLGFVACDARGAAPLCVAGVALGDVHLDITWQVPFLYVIIVGFVAVGKVWLSRSTPHSADSWSAVLPHTEQHLSLAPLAHTCNYNQLHTYIRTLIHAYIHTCMHTYIHTSIPTYHFTFSIFHHLLCLSFLPCPR